MMDDVTFLASLTEDSVVAWVSRYFYVCICGPIQLLSGLHFLPFRCTPGLLCISTLRSLLLSLSPSPSISYRPRLSVCLSLSISFSLTSVKCNWRSSLHMAHRHGGDIVCAVAANCSPCSSEPIPLLHFSPPPLFKPCPYSHYFISQPSLSPLSSPIPPILAVLLNYSIFFCGPSTGFKILALYGVIFLLVRIQRKVARRMSFSGSTFNLHT